MLKRRLQSLLILALSACAGDASLLAGPTRHNVLLITLDTTRADRLGSYGYGQGRTPAIDGIAAKGILFENAYTSSVMTLPSHASILTGLLPPAHAVRGNGTYRLRPGVRTVAEVLGEAGYRTGAFVSAAVLDSMFGLDQGFELYDDTTAEASLPGIISPERNAAAVTDAALAWLARTDDRPWFLWVHYFDPQYPLVPPEPYRSDFAARLYDGEIAYMDAAIGRLLGALEGTRGGERTITIVVGDHGEGLDDHGEFSHGVFLYDETARVPFIIGGPGLSPGPQRVKDVVRTIDVAPTLLDLLDLRAGTPMDGVSLRPVLKGGEPAEPLAAYSEAIMPATMFGWSPLAALRTGKWKYVHAPRPELYDLQSDPGETRNLIDEHRPVADRLRGDLEGILRDAAKDIPKPDRVSMDAEQIAKLRSLGYVAGGDPSFRQALDSDPLVVLAGASRSLADPKDRVDRLGKMLTVRQFVIKGELEKAVDLARRLVEMNPDNSFIRMILATAYRHQGRLDLAIAQYRAITSRQPENADAWIGAGWVLLRMEDLEGAKAAYTRALAINPRHIDAISSLGSLYLVEGDFEQSEQRFRQVLERRPNHITTLLTLAKIAETQGRGRDAKGYYQRVIGLDRSKLNTFLSLAFLEFQEGNHERALEILDDAGSHHPERAEISVARGDIYMNLGKLTEAGEEFEAATARAPQAPQGYHGLGLLAARRGDFQQARRFFQQALRADPGFTRARAELERLSRR
jgi:arylsulfatase A-like enzyme/Tfp pilus assembly protein PilF